jgi:hypothetical protein
MSEMATPNNPITIHVDYNPDHDCMTFGDTNGEPILSYRAFSTTRARVRDYETGRSRRLLDGWVLEYEGAWTDLGRELSLSEGSPDDYITGIEELTAVDEAVAAAQRHLADIGYRKPWNL